MDCKVNLLEFQLCVCVILDSVQNKWAVTMAGGGADVCAGPLQNKYSGLQGQRMWEM